VKLSFSHTSLKDFNNCPLSFYHKRILKDVVFVQGPEAKWGEEVHKHFEDRVKLGTPLPFTLEAYEQVLAKFDGLKHECELQMALNDKLEPTEWFADDAWVRGIADIMVWLTPKKVWIGDYKTGKRRPDFDQLELFSLLTFQHCPEVEECTTSFIWTKDKAMDTETFHRKDANKMWERVMSRIRRVYAAQEKDNWPAKPSGLCGWCDVKKQKGCVYAR
jgi:RecB family exonuclease